MKKVKIACAQMSCSSNPMDNITKAIGHCNHAAQEGAKIVVLPELFERQYFCQERQYDYFAYAQTLEESAVVAALTPISQKLGLVIPVSFYEKGINVMYNSVAILDCGKVLGVYRKIHIPDDQSYQEKFYFTPGDTGFKTFATSQGVIGVGVSWDQWFPEDARALTLNGAELILYPTSVGSQPVYDAETAGQWRRVMCGQAAANLIPIAVANRIGCEQVLPCTANGGQRSSLTFFGSSFICNERGKVISSMGAQDEGLIFGEFDLGAIAARRMSWGCFRDRRPECYKDLTK
jgi:N-carbamoylputrescine amidase